MPPDSRGTRKFWAARLPVPVLREVLKFMEEHEVYAAVGQDGFERLVAAFYRQVPGDSILGPMYQGRDLAAAEARLRGFLIYRFGGPQTYIEERGHPRLRMRHNPFEVNQAARESWMKLMTAAMDEVNLPPAAREVLRNFFDSTATFLINRPD
jgi:hemoglobin